ncbi:MAG: hypothetical protein M1840_000514 [Geoglossum simile]|nr:MAG: hypothetical protein M1840_000514 [Geoglossum simile]
MSPADSGRIWGGIIRRQADGTYIAFWLVPITIQVFAAETAVRALRSPRFPPRGKRSVPICLVAVVMLIILTWIPSRAYPAGDSCIASLMFYIRNKGRAGVVTISCITIVIIAAVVIIIIQLSRNVNISDGERIAASRMVYYLVVTTIIMAFAFPYFVERTRNRNSDVANMMATIALNIWGLTNSFLHLFLRANATSTAIKPSALSWSKEKRRTIFGPSDLSLARNSLEASSLHRSSTDNGSPDGTEKSGLFVPPEAAAGSPSKTDFYSPFRNTLSSTRGFVPLNPTGPEVTAGQPTPTSSRTPLYSPFPRVSSQQSLPPPLPTLPRPRDSHSSPSALANGDSSNATLSIPYDDFTLPSRTTHSRSSVASSATVQIGLRISNAIAIGMGNIPGPSPIPAPLRVPGAQKMLPPTPAGEKDVLPRLPEVVVTTESGRVGGGPRPSRPSETWI